MKNRIPNLNRDMNAVLLSLDRSTVISTGLARKTSSRAGLLFTYEPSEFKETFLSKVKENALFLFEFEGQTLKISVVTAALGKPIRFGMAPL